ncbi:MAG: ATP-binding protein [Thermodesulfovibrionia bacterium]
MLKRIPLTPKMLLITVTVGVIAWGLLDYIQSSTLKDIFLAQLTERLSKQALEDRISFDRYIKKHNLSAKLIVSQKNFFDYIKDIEKKEWSSEDVFKVKFYKHPPSWFPKRSALRLLVQPRYAFLLDAHRQVREVYQGWPKPPPASLLRPTDHLYRVTHNQGFMTDIDGSLYIITMESLLDSQERLRATLMLASPIDEEFLHASQASLAQGHLVALLSGGEPRILASNRPDLLPIGTKLDAFKDRYLITGKAYFDYGSSDKFIGFASFIPKKKAEAISSTILSVYRKQHAVSAVVLIVVFSLIMLWVTQNIHRLSEDILDFSKNTLGIRPKELEKGDQLFILKKQFQQLTESVIESKEALLNRSRQLEILSQTSQQINTVLEIPVIMRNLVKSAIGLIGATSGTAGLMFDEKMVFTEYNRDGRILPIDYTFESGYGVPGYVMETKKPYITNDAEHNPYVIPEIQKKLGFYNLIDIPILNRTGKLLGCLELHNKIGKEKFNQNDLEMLQGLTASCAIALENAKILRDLVFAESGLRIFAERLKTSNAELQDFAYIVSHDLREPLRKITMFGERVKEKYTNALDDQGRDYLERMQNASERMQTLISGLLEFSQITTRAKPFVPVDLSQVANEVLSDLEAQIDKTKGHVEVGNLPTIDADPLQMRQLFQNLISNALKFHQKGKSPVVKVNAQKVKDEYLDQHGAFSSDKLCQITVEDNGIGLEEKYADHIFGVFQRLHSRNEYKGTGIGLSICRKIIERHRGHITVRSKPGQGTTFTIILPVELAAGYNDEG